MTFDELEFNIKQYLMLEDKGIVKLLCATVVANRIIDMDPTWLFIISNSSGGKSELLSAVSSAQGCHEQDDLTANTFISGATRGGVETSLLFRLPKNPILIIKDLTMLLDKDQREANTIFAQLRLIYDGKLYKSFGTGEDIRANVRMGLIAGMTGAIEDTQARQASMGQRAIRYYMKQPDRYAVTRLVLKSKKEKEKRIMMADSFRSFLDDGNIVIPEDLPELPDDTIDNLVKLSEMATSARSSVKRKEYSRDNRIERTDLKEMPSRMAKQLKNIGQSMMIINNDNLTGLDHRILYQIALDSIPSGRKDVMMAATMFSRMDLQGLAMKLKLPEESVKMHLEDLISLDIIMRENSYSSKSIYYLREDYRELIAKFEEIPMTNNVLEIKNNYPNEEDVPLPQEQKAMLEQVGLI